MVRRISTSQFRSRLNQAVRQAEQKAGSDLRRWEQRVKSEMQRAGRQWERDVNAAINRMKTRSSSSRVIYSPVVRTTRLQTSRQRFESRVTVKVESQVKIRRSLQSVLVAYDDLVAAAPQGLNLLDPASSEVVKGLEIYNAAVVDGADLDEYMVGPSDFEQMLEAVDPELSRSWRGALMALRPDNPERVRHFSTSVRELINHLLRRFAPGADVFEIFPHADRDASGGPTRRWRLNFICRELAHDATVAQFADENSRATIELVNLLNKGTHAAHTITDERWTVVVKDKAESCIRFILSTLERAD